MNHNLAKRVHFFFVLLALLGLFSLSACSGGPTQSGMPLPSFLKDAPTRVVSAYHYAMDNPRELEKYPCYCGCGAAGHTSNRSCYIQNMKEDGTIVWDAHAAGCGICVDITEDVKRLRDQGWTSTAIRTYVDNKYSPFGPPTDTPLPVD
jgi:hypothetical protein